MKCAVHTEVDATGYCRNCGRALCPACTREVQGVLYCESCLAGMVSGQQPTSGGAPGQGAAGPSPGLALVLGFIPGLGAVYNGEYMKALLHVVIFAGLVTANASGRGQPFFGILTAVFYFYMIIDSYRVASARRLGQAAPASTGAWMNDKTTGPIILIALGVLFLLDRHFDVWDRIFDYWPVLLIALGVLMLRKRLWRPS